MRLPTALPEARLGALACRLAPVVTTLLVAALPFAVRPVRITLAFGLVALAFAVLAALVPREPLPLATMVCLLVQYVGATQHLDASSRTATAALEALALFCLHSEFALAAAVPLRASVDASVWRRLVERSLPLGLGGAALTAATVALADHGPRSGWFAPLGVVVAFALGLLAYAARRDGVEAASPQVPRVTERIEPGPL